MGSDGGGTHQAEAAAYIISDRREPDLQASLGQTDPAHPAEPITPLGRAEYLLDPTAYVPDRRVVCFEAIKRSLPTPRCGLHGERHSATGEDELLAVAAGERAVAIHVAWLSGQHG